MQRLRDPAFREVRHEVANALVRSGVAGSRWSSIPAFEKAPVMEGPGAAYKAVWP